MPPLLFSMGLIEKTGPLNRQALIKHHIIKGFSGVYAQGREVN
jgi:hypothetical protein